MGSFEWRRTMQCLRPALGGALGASLLILVGVGAAPSRELGKIKVRQLNEVSGMAASRLNPYVFWLHNDGDSGQLFAVRATGKLASAIDCPIAVEDVEDVALGPGPIAGVDYLYLGDVGDNRENRDTIQVIRVPEPNLSNAARQPIAPNAFEAIRLEYPDGPHDAETLLVDPTTGSLLVVTKEPGRARMYEAPAGELKQGATVKLRLAGTLRVADVSAGSISPDGKWLLLRQEANGWLWPRATGQTVAEAISGEPIAVPVRGENQGPNGEAITFSADGTSYFTVSEGKNQAIYEFPLPSHSDR
jgi:hypothetical protein